MTDLLVASTGGHLAELYRLAARLPDRAADPTWVTFDTQQSRSLLDGQDVRYLPYTGPRAYVQSLRNMGTARAVLASRRFDRVISTGAAPALSFLPLARAKGLEAIYIESAARCVGPSLTGRLLSGVRTQLYTQNRSWAAGRWRYAGSVFDSFEAAPDDLQGGKPLAQIVVMLGTIGRFGFPRLVDRLVKVVPPGASVLWQVGSTDTSHLAIDAVETVPNADLDRALRSADVVVAHAGVGSALAALEAGRCPILIPRSRSHGEHVDDHQALIARELDRRGLAMMRFPNALTGADLRVAASRSVRTIAHPPELAIASPRR